MAPMSTVGRGATVVVEGTVVDGAEVVEFVVVGETAADAGPPTDRPEVPPRLKLPPHDPATRARVVTSETVAGIRRLTQTVSRTADRVPAHRSSPGWSLARGWQPGGPFDFVSVDGFGVAQGQSDVIEALEEPLPGGVV